MIVVFCAGLVALAAVGIVFTLRATVTDGHRRIPPR
jgi:hypothetical protein